MYPLCRSWCPDRVLPQARKYISECLGRRYAEGVILNMEEMWQESTLRVPLVCFLAMGSDPTNNIDMLARKHGISEQHERSGSSLEGRGGGEGGGRRGGGEGGGGGWEEGRRGGRSCRISCALCFIPSLPHTHTLSISLSPLPPSLPPSLPPPPFLSLSLSLSPSTPRSLRVCIHGTRSRGACPPAHHTVSVTGM